MKLTTGIVESAQRASDIIGRIHDMAGKRPPERSLIDLNAIIRNGLVFLRYECADKGVRVQFELGVDLPSVQGERVQRQQVAVNLAVSAIQAMEVAGGTRHTLNVSTASGAEGTVQPV